MYGGASSSGGGMSGIPSRTDALRDSEEWYVLATGLGLDVLYKLMGFLLTLTFTALETSGGETFFWEET